MKQVAFIKLLSGLSSSSMATPTQTLLGSVTAGPSMTTSRLLQAARTVSQETNRKREQQALLWQQLEALSAAQPAAKRRRQEEP